MPMTAFSGPRSSTVIIRATGIMLLARPNRNLRRIRARIAARKHLRGGARGSERKLTTTWLSIEPTFL